MVFKKTSIPFNTANKPKAFKFSNRELDILACFLNDVQTKKIASYLSLSSATVETHIRNLMTKIGCNSRKEIIAFIEQSEHNQLIKKHSTDLLIKISFEQELKEIVKFSYNTNCAIFYYKTTRPKSNLIPQLEKHLTLAGIAVSCKAWNRGKSLSSFASNKNLKNFVIYCLDNTSLEKFNDIANNLIKEIAEVNLKNAAPPIILFLSEQPVANNIKEALRKSKIFVLSEQKNYYLLIFELLKLLVPSYDFAKTLETFNSKHNIYNYTLPLPKDTNKFPFFNRHKFSLKKAILLGMSILFLLSILTIGINNFIYSSIQKIYSQHVNKFKEKEQIILVNLPQRNFSFTGRKESLRQIREYLNKYHSGTITQAISGLGGIGKTQLALEYAYQAAENNVYSAILWITAETENSIYNSYKEIANTLQLKADGLSLENMQSIVHNKLVTKHKKTNLLIVLDNVSTYNEIKSYLTIAHKDLTPFLTPHILITSRSQYWPENSLMLDIFTKEEAFVFVKKYLPNESISSINKLTKKLNYFPLALGQAVSYIKNHTNINDYLELYANKQEEDFTEFSIKNNKFNESLWKTWNISINKLTNTAQELLFISAYLAPDNIPIAFFDHLSTEKRAQAIAELRKYSLVSLVGDQYFKVHRLLQEIIKISIRNNSSNNINKKTSDQNILKTDGYWLMKAMNLLKTKFEYDHLQPNKWGYWIKYLSHAEKIASNAMEIPGNTFQNGFKLYIKATMFSTYIKFDEKYIGERWNRIISLIQKYYRKQVTKFIMANISTHINYVQNWSKGLPKMIEYVNSEIVPTYQQPLPNFSRKERELLDLSRIVPFKNKANDQARNNCDLNFALILLGDMQYSMGHLSQALDYYNKALTVFTTKKLDDVSQCYKINTLISLGCLYTYLGRFVEAEKIFNKPILWENQSYSKYPKQIQGYANLLYHIGEHHKALLLLNKCTKIILENFSPHYHHNINNEIRLGFINYTFGNFDTAKQNFKTAEEICKLYNRVFEFIYINLGFWKIYESLEKYDQALYHMEEVFKLVKLHCKDNANSGIGFQLTDAEIWPILNKHTNIIYWQKALDLNNKLFGKLHYQSARTHYMLGQTLEYEHKFDDACNHYKQALTILGTQKIRHANLKLFYDKNTTTIKAKLKELCKLKERAQNDPIF